MNYSASIDKNLHQFYTLLLMTHSQNFPEWRFAQFIENLRIFNDRKDMFYMENEEFLSLVQSFINFHKGVEK